MSSLAQHFLRRGYTIKGSDCTRNQQVDMLINMGAQISIGHNGNKVDGADMCIYSLAVGKDNVEVTRAHQLGIPTFSREQLLASVFNGCDNCIAVAGTHGKTSTCGLLSSALEGCGKNPTAFIGGLLNDKGNYIDGGYEYCVVEACEYKRAFLTLAPTVGIILNIDLEHLDYYREMQDIESAFRQFAFNIVRGGCLIINGDCIKKTIFDCDAQIVSFGIDRHCDYTARNITELNGRYCFDCYCGEQYLCRVKPLLIGEHNIYNALATVVCCHRLGLDMNTTANGIGSFTGTLRRWSVLENRYTNIVEDYAHHPSELRAIVKTAKLQGYARTVLFFQPHTYSRLQKLFYDFVSCFIGVDKLYLLPIYPARERKIEGITSQALANAIESAGVVDVEYVDSFSNAVTIIKQYTQDDLVLLVGAGDIDNLGRLLTQEN